MRRPINACSKLSLVNRGLKPFAKIIDGMLQGLKGQQFTDLHEVVKSHYEELRQCAGTEHDVRYELEKRDSRWVAFAELKERTHTQPFVCLLLDANECSPTPPEQNVPMVVRKNFQRAKNRMEDFLTTDRYCHPEYGNFAWMAIMTYLQALQHSHTFDISRGEDGTMTFIARARNGSNTVSVITRSLEAVVRNDLEVNEYFEQEGQTERVQRWVLH